MNIQIGHDAALVESKKKLVSGTYLHNAWYVAAWADELAGGKIIGRTFLNEPVVIYREGSGKLVALDNRCPHRFAPLSMGQVLDGNRIQCPYHGLEFDGTGACVLNPHGNKHISSRLRVKSYPVIEKHNAIWIWMGDKTPDPSKVPDFSVMDNVPELHSTKRDKIMIKANVELIIDNLLDLSHTAYLHNGILGNASTVESDIEVVQDGDSVTVSRYARNCEPPGMNKMMWPEVPDIVDKFSFIKWMAPSTLKLLAGICLPGKDPESGSGYHAIHLLTPETDHTTHYFFTAIRFGVYSKGDELNRQIQEKVAATRRFAFEEQDAPVIEAQQQFIDMSQTEMDPVILAIDVGPVRYKQVLKKLIAAEQTP